MILVKNSGFIVLTAYTLVDVIDVFNLHGKSENILSVVPEDF